MRTPMKTTGFCSCLVLSTLLAFSLIVTGTPAPVPSPHPQALNGIGAIDFARTVRKGEVSRSRIEKGSGDSALVPGGIEAALKVVGGRRSSAPKDYFLEVARIAILASSNSLAAKDLLDRVRDHFQNIRAMQALGVSAGNRFVLHLSARTSESRKSTEKILELLGWKLESTADHIKIAPAENSQAARRQVTAAALALNQIAMQAALQSGRDFEFTIADDEAPVMLGDRWRREALEEHGNPPGGLSEVFMADVDLDYLYVSLCGLDEISGLELLKTFDLRVLEEKYSRLLYRFSSSLVVREDGVQLPGGPAAGPVWQRLVGANLSPAGPFLVRLLSKDDGKLLAYFAALMQLDAARQKYFTASLERTAGFYELYRNSLEVKAGAARLQRRMALADFFRQIPLDEHKHVIFPGGPEVWWAAGTRPFSVSVNSLMPRGLTQEITPAMEDEIVSGLARTTFLEEPDGLNGLDTFLAVDHLNSHRSEPLDASCVSLLIRHYRRDRWAWPYLVILGGLQSDGYAQFFRLNDHLHAASPVLQNDVLGELHGLLKILCLLQDSGQIDQGRANLLFREICDRFLRASTAADYAVATLDLAEMVTVAAKGKGRDPDEAFREALLEHGSPVSFMFHGKERVVDAAKEQADGFREVLELQKVPPLAPLLVLSRLLRQQSSSKGEHSDWSSAVHNAIERLPEVDISGSLHKEGYAGDALIHCHLGRIRDLAGRLAEAASVRPVDQKSLKTLSEELLSALNPQVRLAITGIVYAYYFCPGDLLISEDPLFLRKHQYIKRDGAFAPKSIWSAEDLASDEQAGSFFVGGLADFSYAAGKASMSTFRQIDEAARQVGAALIGSLHETHWSALSQADLRLVSLQVRAGRDWIGHASDSSEMLSALSEGTLGLLSPSRRAELLQTLPGHRWATIPQILTLSDLYFLGEEYLRKYGKDSVASRELEALRLLVSQDGAGAIRWLGANPRALYHCSHSHLMRMASYEYYEGFLTPERLATRANEFKLYLAEYLGRENLPHEILGAVAEPIAIAVLKKMNMTVEGDWRAILAAYTGINGQMLEEALNRK